ncbi:FitA-like ribbon-helix-helix domain-containing protein [Labrys wisconsinensis]|uniref:Plasmid stability protein n=1 Tax=Labrys wisconsinensis TaxID=425677 RepID=A0ABU0JKW3_9HYPH|nr:plasmid stabilization protein [Labrys wisconsinensis]MDQ0474918.1 plasmid stability protein [Labrys wisconsinensis]
MASITIRNLEDPLKVKLRLQAARHGRSMEEEARTILRAALVEEPGLHVVERIRRRFADLGGVDLPDPKRDALREPPDFSE